ncbi:MAG: alkaline phosphatase family protein [Armatimonadota bacterium]
MTSGKVVVVGFDGAPPHLLRQWADAGHLPAFARLFREGAGGVLASTPQPNSAPAWSSFATGVNPGRHGIMSFMNRVPNSYSAKRIDANDREGLTFWDLAGQQGARCAVLNVPVTYPVRPLNGVQVADWLCPSLSAPGATYPPELAQEMLQHCGSYTFHAEVKRHYLAGHHSTALDQLRTLLHQKAEVGRMIQAREDWDLFVLVFVETDAAQHYYLHTSDEDHPRHPEAVAKGLEGALLDIYRHCDQILGDVMSRLDDDTTLMVMSDHGATANTYGRCYMRSFLNNIGLLQMRQATSPQQKLKQGLARTRKWGFETLNAYLPKSLKVKLNDLLPQARERVFADAFTTGVDWAQTRAYSYYWETDPYVNLQGRDPDGIVAPGTAYDEVRTFVTEQLLAARDSKTGNPVVSAVLRKDGLFHGPHFDLAPDLLVQWERNQIISGIVSKVTGQEKVARAELRDDTLGSHDPEGTLLLWGRNVKPGELAGGEHIMDLAPSILALLGCRVPDDLDGKLLPSLDVSVETATVAATTEADPEMVYSAEEEAEVEDRLRNLGYL